jgi:sensor c-di-GMP phosphodiesterase-like protein
MFRKLIVAIALVFTGTILGIAAGRIAALTIQTRMGNAELESYAEQLLHNGERLSADAMTARETITNAKLPFCSKEEIALMRKILFHSKTVHEIERIRDGEIHCTAVLGEFEHSLPMGQPDIQIGEFKAYLSSPIASVGDSLGYISEWPGIAVVMNRDITDDLDQPPMTYAGYYYSVDANTHQPKIFNSTGHQFPISEAELLAGQLLQREDVVYFPRCVPRFAFCVAVAEPRQAMVQKTHWIYVLLVSLGAFAGTTIGLQSLLFFRRQRTMGNQLRRAIRSGTLKMVYQPILDLDRNAIIGAEALLRWIDESGESVRPDVFISVAEEHRFISTITDYVVDHVIRDFHEPLTGSDFHVSVNIAAQDLADPDFCTRIASKLQVAGIAPQALALELTERSTADDERVIERIAHLREAGHIIYLDDFGTGYSSLAYLHRLEISAIKIDKSFTRTIGTGAITASIVPQLLAIATELQLQVVVEGIETHSQIEYFRNANTGIFGQGYLLGGPMTATQLKQLLSQST